MGTGEKIDEFEEFHPDRIAGRILGQGDVISLVETAMEIINSTVTKSSGAEMRAWSEMGQQMSEEDYGKIVDGFIYMVAGVAGMASMPAGLVIGAVGLIVSWCR